MWIFEKFSEWQKYSKSDFLYSNLFHFEENKREFSPVNCYALAQLCGQSYNLDIKKIKSWKLKYKQIDIDSSRCTIFWNRDFTILAFAGTDSISDMIRDMAIEGLNWSEISYVHRGFYESTLKIYEPILAFLEKNMLFSKPLWITGHSLGAAQAILTSLKLFKDRKKFSDENIRGIYTFAQPKVGGPFFSKEAHEILSERFFRIVNEGDIIPYLPDRGFLSDKEFRYEHLKTGYLKYSEDKSMLWVTDEETITDMPAILKMTQNYQENILSLQRELKNFYIPQVIDYNSRYFFQTIAFFLNHAIEIYIEKAKYNFENSNNS